MYKIYPNFFMLTLRIILLPLFTWMIVLPISRLANKDFVGREGIFFIGLLFFVMFWTFLFLTLFGIFKIRYNEEKSEITFYGLFKSRTITTAEIKGYYQTRLTTNLKNYSGFIILLSDGSNIELTEYNVKPLNDFYSFIVKSNIPFKGAINSWYPIKRRLPKDQS